MKAIELQTDETAFWLKIDKTAIDKEVLIDLIQRIRFEYLIKKADFDEDIVELGEEIKAEWWAKNKERLLGDALKNEESSR